ncbi:MAG: hypothetical protein HOJ79_02610 [Nitrospina sp.]|jgi:hypothetical protein|nr:hypothetical protein [Nitrospina sp.]
MTLQKSNYQVINMCEFCEKEFGSCGGNPLFSYEIDIEKICPNSLNSVVACDKYENPVAATLSSFKLGGGEKRSYACK